MDNEFDWEAYEEENESGFESEDDEVTVEEKKLNEIPEESAGKREG